MTIHEPVAGVVALLFLLAAALAIPDRRQPGAVAYVGLLLVLSAMAGSLGAAGTPYVSTADAFGIFLVCWALASPLWAVFAIAYTGRGPALTRLRVLGLLALGVTTSGVSLGVIAFDPLAGSLYLIVFAFQLSIIALAVFGVSLVIRSGVTYDDLPVYRSITLAAAGLSVTLLFTVALLADPAGVGTAVTVATAGLSVAVACFLLAQVRLGTFDSDPSAGYLARETVLDQMSECVFLVDREHQLLDVNDTAVETFDIEGALTHGEPIEAILGVDMTERGEGPVTLETRAGQREFASRASDLTRSGDRIGTIYTLRDVTDRRTDEQRLAVLNRVLRHNLRNDLDAIRAFAESLDDPTVDRQRAAERIERTAREVASIGDTVDSADRLARSDGADRQRVDVTDLARQVLARQFRSYPDATADVSGSAHTIYTDLRTLETVLSELVENAVKHNDQPDRRVDIEVAESDRGVELAVRDNGPGIPENERTVLLEGEETPLNHGTGLGLWLVYWGVKRLGGSLRFTAADPRGSVVTVTVPSLEASDPPAVAAGD